MKINVLLSYIFIVLVLVASLYLLFGNHRKPEIVEKCVTDTLVVFKTDTVVKYEPTYITKRVTDTLYLPSDSNKQQPLVIEQKHYQDKGIYDAWISGYNAQLDSIKTYPQIKETTITKTITKEIERKGLNIYPYIGINNFNHRLNPVMGIATEINNNTIFIGEMGHINDRLYYGVRIGFKIN
jgi:hypothetical protein